MKIEENSIKEQHKFLQRLVFDLSCFGGKTISSLNREENNIKTN